MATDHAGKRPLKQGPGSGPGQSPKVAMPKVPVTSRQTAKKVAPQIAELRGCVGKRVTITNILNHNLTGNVYACDASELILDTDPDSYHIVQLSKITKFEIVAAPQVPQSNSATEFEAQRQRERDRQAKLKAERLAKPSGVSDVGHRIFLTLDKTLPVRWHEKTIVVLDNVLIEPPYDVENCKAPAKHEKQLQRVKELVKAELAKMPKENTWDRRGG